jgi:hypothetical protein
VISDGSGERLLPPCWADLPRCQALTDGEAAGALLGNDSRHTPLPACSVGGAPAPGE